MESGLDKIAPHRKDFSLVKTYGMVAGDAAGLPENFSIYDGRDIPNQNALDYRFTPPVKILPYGCVGETGSFDSGIQDGKVYRPDVPYLNTYPYSETVGRDMRVVMQALIDAELLVTQEGTKGPKRLAYFNCYGASKIDDFDAVRLALYVNQSEKRGVWVGSWWFPDFANHQEWQPDGTVTSTPLTDGILAIPRNWSTNVAALHAHLVTGWRTINGVVYLESLSWQGMQYGDKGKVYFSRELYNALMKQPWTGAFTITKYKGADSPVPVGLQAIADHIAYFIRNLFNIILPSPSPVMPTPVILPPAPVTPAPVTPTPTTPPPAVSKYNFDTPQNARHSFRVICDEQGLTHATQTIHGKVYRVKDILCACIDQESQFKNTAVGRNVKNGKLVSTDWGICQINDYYHCGPGKEFPSAQYVVAHPEDAVRFMIRMYKAGKLNMWVSYSSGAYEKYLPQN